MSHQMCNRVRNYFFCVENQQHERKKPHKALREKVSYHVLRLEEWHPPRDFWRWHEMNRVVPQKGGRNSIEVSLPVAVFFILLWRLRSWLWPSIRGIIARIMLLWRFLSFCTKNWKQNPRKIQKRGNRTVTSVHTCRMSLASPKVRNLCCLQVSALLCVEECGVTFLDKHSIELEQISLACNWCFALALRFWGDFLFIIPLWKLPFFHPCLHGGGYRHIYLNRSRFKFHLLYAIGDQNCLLSTCMWLHSCWTAVSGCTDSPQQEFLVQRHESNQARAFTLHTREHFVKCFSFSGLFLPTGLERAVSISQGNTLPVTEDTFRVEF